MKGSALDSASAGGARLRVDDVSVELSGTRIIDGASVIAEPGEVTGVVGPNGSGKSTLLRTVYRSLQPTAGQVLVGDQDLLRLNATAAARVVAAVPQERSAELDLTVRDVVALGRIPHQGRFGGESARDKQAVAAAIADVGLTEIALRDFADLSGGERQRALLARCFAQGGRILVLDEPANHLDVNHQVQLLRLLRRSGATTLITMHDLNAAAAVCDSIFVLSEGAIVAHGAPEDVLTAALLQDVFGVQAALLRHPRTGRLLIAFDYLGDESGESAHENPS